MRGHAAARNIRNAPACGMSSTHGVQAKRIIATTNVDVDGRRDMGVPKRKSSKARTNRRFRAQKKQIEHAVPCPNCGKSHLPHRVCPSCGYYRGRQVLIVSTDE